MGLVRVGGTLLRIGGALRRCCCAGEVTPPPPPTCEDILAATSLDLALTFALIPHDVTADCSPDCCDGISFGYHIGTLNLSLTIDSITGDESSCCISGHIDLGTEGDCNDLGVAYWTGTGDFLEPPGEQCCTQTHAHIYRIDASVCIENGEIVTALVRLYQNYHATQGYDFEEFTGCVDVECEDGIHSDDDTVLTYPGFFPAASVSGGCIEFDYGPVPGGGKVTACFSVAA